MRADQNVYLALLQVGEYLFDLFGALASAQVLYAHGEVAKAFAEGIVVLHSEHGRGHQYSHLLAVRSGFEGGTHRHLGLTKSHVAAHQSVHGHGALHIVLDVQGGFGLIGCIFVEEGCLQLVLHIAVGRVGKALLLLAGGV